MQFSRELQFTDLQWKLIKFRIEHCKCARGGHISVVEFHTQRNRIYLYEQLKFH